MNGKSVKLEAVVTGVPKPTVQWFKDDIILDEKSYILESKDKTHSVTITEANPNHTGTYRAVAENAAGRIESTAVVQIHIKPQVTKPEDVKIISGSVFSVPIKIEGIPKPKIKWMKDKVEIPASLGISIEEQENVHTMYLNESTISLNGNYSVAATNQAGSDTVNFKVVVLGKLLSVVPFPETDFCFNNAIQSIFILTSSKGKAI